MVIVDEAFINFVVKKCRNIIIIKTNRSDSTRIIAR